MSRSWSSACRSSPTALASVLLLALAGCHADWDQRYAECLDAGRCEEAGGGSGGAATGGGATGGGATGGGSGGGATGGGATGGGGGGSATGGGSGGGATGGGATGGGSGGGATGGGATGGGSGGGAAPGLTWSPSAWDAGSLELGATRQQAFRLENLGAARTGALTVSLTGDAAFSMPANACGAAGLNPTAVCSFTVTFAPGALGSFAAQLDVFETGATSAVVVPLSGRAATEFVHLSIRADAGTGAGVVTITPLDAGLAPSTCPSSCELDFPRHTEVLVSAAPSAATAFGGFSSGCVAATDAGCRLHLADDGGVSLVARFDAWPRLTVSVSPPEAAAYGARVTAPGIDCPSGACSAPVDPAMSTVLVSSGGSAFAVPKTASGCDGGASACLVTVTGDLSVAVDFALYNRVFVSPTPVPLSLGGQAPYSALCDAWARDAGFPGTRWVAFMGTDAGSPFGADAGGSRGWLRPDGRPFADELLSPSYRTYYPPVVDAYGVDLGRDGGRVLLATAVPVPGTGVVGTCGDWSSSSGTYTAGVANGAGHLWSASASDTPSCGTPARVLCFQADWQTPLPPASVPDGGRLAFLLGTPRTYDLGSNPCSVEGAARFPGRSFAPLIAYGGNSPMVSWNFSGGATATTTWYRPDGVALWTAAELGTQGFVPHAPLTVFSDGGYAGPGELLVWTGSHDPNLAGNYWVEMCNSWGNSGSGSWATLGAATEASSRWFFATNGPFCAQTHADYCLER